MIHEQRDDQGELPEWFQSPEPHSIEQNTLFPEQIEDVLVRLRVSPDDLARWRDHDWVSFGPDRQEPVEQWHVDEIQFVRDVVRSGLSDAHLDLLLSELPRPMNFDPATVAYSFSFGWVQAIPPRGPDTSDFMDEHLGEWLEELAASEPERLVALRNQVEGLLSLAEADDQQCGSGQETSGTTT